MNSTELTKLASRYVNNTNRSIFLTGKAGTGKTTFLKNIVHCTYKNVVVAAPTGIAAINAKGVTLHSLFQLPFGTFVPENIQFTESATSVNTPRSVVANLQMHKTKRNLLRQLDLLIIDEVSMLRADLLDCIDTVLRFVRRNQQPFGGVQLLLIGDLLQLPPVVKNSEWNWLSKYYKSAFFFDAIALKNAEPIYIELDKIYRQSNEDFIGILNHLRHNELTADDISVLNSHYKPDFNPKPEDGYIHLTTHNRIADEINKRELEKLAGDVHSLTAKVKGDFDEKMFPIEENMKLKVGAQVMFIKNDPTGEKRFYNGKIGTVKSFDSERGELEVECTDADDPISVERYTWENTRYKLNEETNLVAEIVKGTFEHFPIRLAWAITVHKSQGLTFEKAIMDLSQSFAAGQMYVALSRLTSLDGLVLSQPIKPLNLNTHGAIGTFELQRKDIETLGKSISMDAKTYHGQCVSKAFDFGPLLQNLGYHITSYKKDTKRASKQKYIGWARELSEQAKPLKEVGDKFINQVNAIVAADDYLPNLIERVSKAQAYFEPMINSLTTEVNSHIEKVSEMKGVKAYLKELVQVKNEIDCCLLEIAKLQLLLDAALNNEELTKEQLLSSGLYAKKEEEVKIKKKKPEPKVNTKDVSLKMFNSGSSIEEIAEKRSLVPGTIEGHLADFVKVGAITTERLIDSNKLKNILTVIKKIDSISSGAIKEKLGSEYSYGEVKIAVAQYQFTNQNKD